MTTFTTTLHHATPHGVLAGVTLPAVPSGVPESVFSDLPEEEAEHARSLRGHRQTQFVAGRLALRAAANQLGFRLGPSLPDERGAPILPKGLVGSISHKSDLAVALVARDHGATLGVDLEDYAPERPAIAPSILTARELEEIAGLEASCRWIAVLERFSIKEALYKALDPHVRRYIGFREVEVTPDLHGRAEVRLDLAHGEGPFRAEARYEWLRGRLLTSARVVIP